MVEPPKRRSGWSARHYRTLACLFAASACGMFGCGPGTMSLAFFGMSKDNNLRISDASMSALLSLGSAGFSFGKLFGGPLSDHLGGKRSLCLILSTMGACQVFISQKSGLRALAVVWFITRAAHATTWCGVMLVTRPWFMENNMSTALSLLTASCPTGAFGGALLGGRLLATRGWRGVAQHTGILTLATAFLVQLGVSHPPTACHALVQERQQQVCATDVEPVHNTKSMRRNRRIWQNSLETAKIILCDAKLWAVYVCSALITPTLDLPTLLPAYLDTLGVDPLTIGWLGSLFSLAAVPAVLGGGWLHQRLERKQHKWFYVPLLCLSACGLCVLSTIQGHSPHRVSFRTLLFALMQTMSGMSPSFYVPTYDYIMRFGGPYTGTLTGLCDFFGGVVCTLFYSFYPRLLRRGGWALVFKLLATMNIASAAAIATFCALEERAPLIRSPLELLNSDKDDGGE